MSPEAKFSKVQKTITLKENIDILNLVEIKNFSPSKDAVKEMNVEPTDSVGGESQNIFLTKNLYQEYEVSHCYNSVNDTCPRRLKRPKQTLHRRRYYMNG